MEIAKSLPSYGCVKFPNCIIDFPKPNELSSIVIGNKELCIQSYVGEKCTETRFKVIRMRCWRVTMNYGVSRRRFRYRFGTDFQSILLFYCRTKKSRRIPRQTAAIAVPAVAQTQWNSPLSIWCRRTHCNGSRLTANTPCWCPCVCRASSTNF